MNYLVSREFNSLYIFIDIVWLVIYGGLLFYFKKRLAVIAGVLAGIIYFIVDYGIFYLLLHARTVHGANPLLFLFWLSMSYGFTNFAWIWILLDNDKNKLEWSLLPILGWVAIGQAAMNFGKGFPVISISRTVSSYHGAMAIILLVGYLFLIVRKLQNKEDVNLFYLLAIGIGVQFAWELSLLLNGIRPPQWQPLVINSLIETNLGMPYIYLIHKAITAKTAEHVR